MKVKPGVARPVNRHIGGYEMQRRFSSAKYCVNCHLGGYEKRAVVLCDQFFFNCHADGYKTSRPVIPETKQQTVIQMVKSEIQFSQNEELQGAVARVPLLTYSHALPP